MQHHNRNSAHALKLGTAIGSVLVLSFIALPGIAVAQSATSPAAASPVPAEAPGEIVVTAQKRAESINSVGMSITAVTGDSLIARGIVDTTQLAKIVPGFNYTLTGYATPVYTIRGVGFQDNTLSGSPTVSVYVDEVPIPLSAESLGAGLDIQRVEVLKGPQGTLYGQNSTGGAINYIAAKPTNTFQAGFDASYGRFNTADIQGFVSGPLSDTLRVRIAARTLQSGDWQNSYTRADSNGQQNQFYGRVLLDWTPVDRLKVSINLNAWQDKSDTQAFQAVGIVPGSKANAMLPAVANYPLSPANDRAADWYTGLTQRHDNWFAQGSVRLDYDLAETVKFTSISSYEHFKRNQPFDSSGTDTQDFNVIELGHSSTFFQELRLSGSLADKLNWLVGANYESDKTFENLTLIDADASTRLVGALPFRSSAVMTEQNLDTKAVYANADYKITPGLDVQGGIRYTSTDRSFSGCSYDDGNGDAAAVYDGISSKLRGGAASPNIQPGGCYTLDSTTFLPGTVTKQLDQHNVSWRVGPNWKVARGILLYANVSRGYKVGSFPTLAASYSTQYSPVTQESVLAYEAGAKLTLFDRTFQLNGAGFYYKYDNKQIRGKLIDPVFGALGALVNVPESHLDGFEVSAVWTGIQGLTISPAASMVYTRIDGNFYNYSLIGTYGLISGEAFPYTPKWTGNVDVQYDFPLNTQLNGFVGGNYSFQSSTNGGFGALPAFDIKAYQLLDLRAGVATADGKWRFSLYAHNVANTYYWTSASHLEDIVTRVAGMPATYGASVSFRFK